MNNLKLIIKLFLINFSFLFPVKFVKNLYQNQFRKKLLPLSKNLDKYYSKVLINKFDKIGINKDTTFSNIGSCFGVRISNYLSKNINNYLVYEKTFRNASVNWGHVYNIMNLSQVINYSLDIENDFIIEKCSKGYFDPLRATTIGYYDSLDLAKKSIIDHRLKSKKLLETVDVLIITIGQNEGWHDSKHDIVWGFNPPFDFDLDEDRFEYKEFDFNSNYEQLRKSLHNLQKINTKIKFILTVGPITNYTTFLDNDVVSQSFVEKSNIRLVFNELEKDNQINAYYFPLLEMIFLNQNKNYSLDNKHISKKVVDKVYIHFDKFIKK